tara:strand:- start:116 stop:730 length:615 start_codon:yes stop_codon:yes gene_type:complete
MEDKKHWENIYLTKKIDGVSWYEKNPNQSLKLIKKYSIGNSDKVIDVGCGKSFLADNLLKMGYKNISLLDISSNALNEVDKRLKSNDVNFIETNILDFTSDDNFDIWHDRAVFHFITEEKKIKKYVTQCNKYLNNGGFLIIGTFAEDGPLKCSGLKIKRYSINDLVNLFKGNFRLIEGFNNSHQTPFNTEQKFSICIFQKFDDN